MRTVIVNAMAGLLCLALTVPRSLALNPSANMAGASAARGVDYLAGAMDQFHSRFPVYDDVSSAGNHFPAFAKIPDTNAPVDIDGSDTSDPHSGATAIKNVFNGAVGFGGFYFLNGILPAGETAPLPNFGSEPNAGIDLSGATALHFWARGQAGHEVIDFFVGGVGRNADTGEPTEPFPDSTPRYPPRPHTFELTTDWQQFDLDLTGLDLSYVLGGFGWVASAQSNPNGAVFYLDDIEYRLDPTHRAHRLGEPRLIRSFTTESFQLLPPPVGQFDLVLRNIAFTYDNAVAIIALLAEGTPDTLERAGHIGDAFVYASQHDRTYDDGRLRDAYAGGDIALPPGWTPNGRSGTVPVSGFYDEGAHTFVEVEQQGLSTGNNAWAMIALLALYRHTAVLAYLDAARRIGTFIRTFRDDTGLYGGFQGGLDDPETATPKRRPWASTEHNLDCYAAFTVMGSVTGEREWQSDADHARQFVQAMWDADRGCYLAGTLDPATRNTLAGQLPVDAQPWGVLALPDALTVHPGILDCAELYHRTTDLGFSGFDFNENRDGIWFEGTADMAVAYAFAGMAGAAEDLRSELRRAQATVPFGDTEGIAAASHDGVSTGFRTPTGDDFKLFRRLHVGATAWNVLAQLGVNPFYGVSAACVAPGASTCDDGNACTTGESCQAGVCTGGTMKPCPATDQCHDAGTCDPSTGLCSNPAQDNGTPCNDGNACTMGETCQGGSCTAGATKTCTPSGQCHDAGTCDVNTGVCSNPSKASNTPCNDGDPCRTGETCQAGICGPGTPITTRTLRAALTGGLQSSNCTLPPAVQRRFGKAKNLVLAADRASTAGKGRKAHLRLVMSDKALGKTLMMLHRAEANRHISHECAAFFRAIFERTRTGVLCVLHPTL
jgi:hypothetical protein